MSQNLETGDDKTSSPAAVSGTTERIVIGSERVRNRRRLSSKIYKSASTHNSPSPPPEQRASTAEERSAGDGSSRSDEEAEEAELARLRCTSERTEVIAEREQRRRRRRQCSDYPGISFGTSIFSSDTLMKFSVIKNELHNVLNSQLKRVSPVKPSL